MLRSMIEFSLRDGLPGQSAARQVRAAPRPMAMLCALLFACSDRSATQGDDEQDASKLVPDASPLRQDAGAADGSAGAKDADIPDSARDAGLYARARAELTLTKPRQTVDPTTAEPKDLDAATALWPVQGTATFSTTSEGVDLTMRLRDCRAAYTYPVSIHEISDCGQIARDAPAWDGERGQGITRKSCVRSLGVQLYYSRPNSAAKPWTIGGPDASNLIGRTLVVRDPETREPLACGTIRLDGDAGTPAEPGSQVLPSPDVLAQLAGICTLRLGVYGSPSCPDSKAVADCASLHCGLSECVRQCSDYVACLSASSDPCHAECFPEGACGGCLSAASKCTLGFCESHLGCAPPRVPGGGCSVLENCCARQGPVAEACYELAALEGRLGGDGTCAAALMDRDVLANGLYVSPCLPDGGVAPPDAGLSGF